VRPEGKVVFVGAGPGAADLITVRGARVIAEADIVIWASSLVHPGIVAGAKPGREVVDSASGVAGGHGAALPCAPATRACSWPACTPATRPSTAPPPSSATCAAGSASRTRPSRASRPTPRPPPGCDVEITVPEVSRASSSPAWRAAAPRCRPRDRPRVRRARHDDGALPVGGPQQGAPGGTAGRRLPARHAVHRRLPGDLARRDDAALSAGRAVDHHAGPQALEAHDRHGRAGPGRGPDRTRSHLYHPGFRHEYRRADPAAQADLRARGAVGVASEHGAGPA
jgi:precorrin-4/cobalt-precorrin-4 C11-methyltransferase